MRIPMHRFKYTKLTKEQIGAKLKAAEGGPRSASAFSNGLNNKTVRIVTQDGPTLEYRFAANKRLTLMEGGKQVSAGYGELTLNQMVFFKSSACLPSTPRSSSTVASFASATGE